MGSMDPARRVGEVLAGKYRLERLLGVGGMGAVYEAVHLGVEKRFAVKVLKSDVARAPDSVTRFTQEARAAARIGHPNLVEVFDMGETEEGTLYMVMELLTGRSLFEALRNGPLTPDEALTIAAAMLSALDAAHRAGFVHRDIKPANIFLANRLTESGHGQVQGYSVKLLDFGIAKLVSVDTPSLTQTGAVVGTPLYMAPEQVMAESDVDGRADVWAVGAALFEMLTGRPVHLAQSATAAAVKVVTEVAPRVRSLRPEVDPGVDALVARALAVDRKARFATAGEMLIELEVCRTGLGPTQADSGLAPSVATVVRNEILARTRRTRLAMLGVGAASLLLGVGVVFMLRSHTASGAADPSSGSGTATPATAPTVTPPPTPTVLTTAPPVVTPPASTSATATPSASAPSAPSASSVAAAHPTIKHPPLAPPVACAPSEHATKGHCCSVGLEWQTDHCDRPLATQVPF